MKITKLFLLTLTALSVSSAFGQEVAGKTMLARGEVLASDDAAAASRKLKRRSPIYGNDVVVTGAKAKAQLRMTDGGMIALKENSELQIANYQYSSENQEGEVVLELIKGGLRSVTGKIKSEEGNYRLNTPVGSIGIRGTHYEVEMVGNSMMVAVWDGAIDIDIGTGDLAGTTVSFGEGEDYSFAAIDGEGNVTELLEPPENFESGMSSETEETDSGEGDEDQNNSQGESASADDSQQSSSEEESSEEEQSSNEAAEESEDEAPQSSGADDSEAVGDETPQTAEAQAVDEVEELATDVDASSDKQEQFESLQQSAENTLDTTTQSIVDDETNPVLDDINNAETTPLDELLMDRSGSYTYSQISSFDGSSTAGGIQNFQISMAVDFDTLGVTAGNLTFEDAEGDWAATFSGNIESDGDFNLAISEASHGNNFADGTIDASFFIDLESISGQFFLFEVHNPDVNTEGNFIIK